MGGGQVIAELFAIYRRSGLTSGNGLERWIRNFNGIVFENEITTGGAQYEHLICERFGPFTFGIAFVLDNEKLNYVVRRCSFL